MQCLQWGTMSNRFFSQFLRIYMPLGPWHCYCLPPALAQDHLLLFRVTSLVGGVSFFSFFLYIGPLVGLIFIIISNYYIFLDSEKYFRVRFLFCFCVPSCDLENPSFYFCVFYAFRTFSHLRIISSCVWLPGESS